MTFEVIIEIPRGSKDKIEYDEEKKNFFVDFAFKNGLTFINNYGFIANTKAGDGDTLDAYVLSSKVLKTGDVVKCKPIGVMIQLDRGEVDNKILAVPVDEPEREISEEEKDQFRKFYAEVARQKNKIVEIKSFEGPEVAIAEINRAMNQ